MVDYKREQFRQLSNKERAETYAKIKPHTTYYSTGPSFLKWIHDSRFNSLKKLMGDVTKGVILDAGCGEGYFFSQIKAMEKYGIDISEKRLKTVISFPDSNVICSDLKKLPFEDKKFDVIVCSEVLEHVDRYEEVVLEFKRCLKPSGKLILSFPNESMVCLGRLLIMRLPVHELDHVNSLTISDMKKLLSDKYVASNIPPLPYPLCLYQVYKFEARDFKN
jgi:2-polyprenyl-3-methyl-5-hydroxy-6-metoxy-1,4-benzoquinol methylase